MNKKLILRINKNINEARLTIDDEYNKNWSDIPREDFDTIIAMDPKTDIATGFLGPNAKQLLLPKYRAGEKDFLENGDEVKKALDKFITNRNNYEIKNIALYPSVDIFVKHINDPENNPVEADQTPEKKESKLDSIYNKYYNDIPREIFDQIISLDPNTKTEAGSIGEVAKNLLLNSAKKGEQFILNKNNFDKVKKAINTFYSERTSLDQELQQLTAYENTETFVQSMAKPKESSLVNFVSSYVGSANARHVGSTFKYDVFVVNNPKGASAVAGAYIEQGGPGVYISGTLEGTSRDWLANKYGHWCTTSPTHWGRYNREGQRYYNFMARGKNLTADDRAHNYQFAIKADGTLTSAANGVEVYDQPEKMRLDLFKHELDTPQALDDMIELLSKETTSDGRPGYAALLREVVQARVSKKFSVPFVYTGAEDLINLESEIRTYDPKNSQDTIKEVYSRIPELRIAEGVTEIPFGAFTDWTSIKEIIFPSTLRSIGAQAFKGCRNLKKVKFNDGLQSIGAQAFAGCINLENKRIYLPDSVNRLGQKAFLNTNATLIISSDRQEQSLSVHKSDMQWLADHSIFANTTQESWKVADITEEVLDEKIPRDLSNIYKLRGAHTSTPKINSHNIDKRQVLSSRRGAKIDFDAAQYEEISAIDAANRVARNKSDAEKIRAIYRNDQFSDYLELELRPGWNKVYPVRVPDTVSIKKPDPDRRTGKPVKIGQPVTYNNGLLYTKDNIMHEVQSIDGLYRVLSDAVKIYWTDEYEHLVDNDEPFRNKLAARSDNKNKKFLYRLPDATDRESDSIDVNDSKTWTSSAQWKWAQKSVSQEPIYVHPSLTQYSYEVPDTGSHKARSTGDNQYDTLLVNRARTKKRYLNILKAHKTLLRNRDLYTDEELRAMEAEILEDEKQAYAAYLEDNEKVQKAKRHFINYYDRLLDRNQKRIKEYLQVVVNLEKFAEQKEKALRDLENQYKALLDTDIKNYGGLKDELQKIADAKKSIDSANALIHTKQEACNALKQQIEELQAQLKEQEDSILADSEKVAAQVAEMVEKQKTLESTAERTAEELSDALDNVEEQIEEIKQWFVRKGLKQYSFKKHRELDDRIAPMLTSRDSIPAYVCVDAQENELKFFSAAERDAAIKYAETHPEVHHVYSITNYDETDKTYDWDIAIYSKDEDE